mgnify:CR=1 FL=1
MVWATNVPEWIVLQFALAKIGAILVTVNTSLRARDIDYLLRQSEAATLVHHRAASATSTTSTSSRDRRDRGPIAGAEARHLHRRRVAPAGIDAVRASSRTAPRGVSEADARRARSAASASTT